MRRRRRKRRNKAMVGTEMNKKKEKEINPEDV